MTASALLLSLLAAAAGYLSSPHRRWRPGSTRGWSGLAVLLGIGALAAWIVTLGPVAGIFACASTLMLGAMLMPWLGLWRGNRH